MLVLTPYWLSKVLRAINSAIASVDQEFLRPYEAAPFYPREIYSEDERIYIRFLAYPNYEIWPNKRVVTSFEADYIRIYIDGNERDWSAFRKSVYYKIQQFVRNAYTFDD